MATLPFAEGLTLTIRFRPFTPRIIFHADQRLTVEILEGENAGFSDTVEYQATELRPNLVVLSWQERIGSTIVHVMDFDSRQSYTVMAPAKGRLLRLQGPIERSAPQSRHAPF